MNELQPYHTPWLDAFFRGMAFFDSPTFFFVLIPLLWLCVNWKTGVRIFYIVFVSNVLNTALKALFTLPRPCDLEPHLGLIPIGGYGFPSGAAQTAVFLPSLLILYWRSVWRWPLGVLFFAALSISRIYLGVHFFTDILGGWLVGIGIVLLYVYVFPIVEKIATRPIVMAGGVLLPLCISYALPQTMLACSVAVGIPIGLYLTSLSVPFPRPPQSSKDVIIRACIAIGGTFGSMALIRVFHLPTFGHVFSIRYFMLGLYLAYVAHILCTFHKNRA